MLSHARPRVTLREKRTEAAHYFFASPNVCYKSGALDSEGSEDAERRADVRGASTDPPRSCTARRKLDDSDGRRILSRRSWRMPVGDSWSFTGTLRSVNNLRNAGQVQSASRVEGLLIPPNARAPAI